MPRTIALTAAAAALSMGLGSVPPVLAQETTPAPRSEAVIPDELITSFVVAVLEVNEIAESYQPRLLAAEDPSTRDAIEEEVQMAVIEAIESTKGITIEEYMAVSDAARVDPSVNARVMQQFEEMAPNE